MDERGQVYFDDEEAIPTEDLERYNKAHAAQYALMVWRLLQLKKEALKDAESR